MIDGRRREGSHARPDTPATRWDVRWHCAGVPVRVSPGFWISTAVLGIRYYVDPDAGGTAYFLFWMVAVLVSLLAYEWAHAIIARRLGAAPEMVLYGLGGVTLGVDALPRRGQRILTILVGPLASFGIVALCLGVTLVPFPEFVPPNARATIATCLAMLFWANFYWLLLNLIPIWPLDGGRLAVEIGAGLFGRAGAIGALVGCAITAALLTVWIVLELSWHLDYPYDPRYTLYLGNDVIHLAFSFLLWLRAFQALWGQPADAPSPS